MPTLAVNKRASFDYEILDRYEAGLVLFGHEVKSVKTGHISLKGSYVTLKQTGKPLPELYLINAHIPNPAIVPVTQPQIDLLTSFLFLFETK